MIGFVHDEPGHSNGMDKSFDRGHRTCSKSSPFHKRGVHPLDSVQLAFRTTTCIEETGVFEHANGVFDCDQGGSAQPEDRMAGGQRVRKA